LCSCDGLGVKRSPVKKLLQKKSVFDSSEDEIDDDNANNGESDVSEFEPFKRGSFDGPAASLAERIRSQPPRRTAAASTIKYNFDDSGGDEVGSNSCEEEVFTAVDHGQGDETINLNSPVKQTVSSAISQSQTDANEKSKGDAAAWPISYKESATAVTKRSSARSGRAGSSRRGHSVRGGAVQRGGAKNAGSASTKRITEETRSDASGGESNKNDEADDIFVPDSPVPPSRAKATRNAQRKMRYFFDSDSDEVVEVSSDSEKDADSAEDSNVRRKGRVAVRSRKRKRLNSDSDEDYVPE
uniref:Mif2_N domain-containing protein n=1 Tax=Hydatigena taeniaeformis TaxID=6205 RepID=A0A0R3WMY1_HYDTA